MSNKRLKKGKSLLDFPNSYTVIDIETTGFDFKHDSIIEIGAIKYVDGIIIDTFNELLKPDSYLEYNSNEEISGDYIEQDGIKIQYINDYIIHLTGITNSMLNSARNTSDVLSDFFDFIGSDILIGHNVNFDINFLYDSINNILGKDLTNDFIDTLRFARIWLKKLEDKTLHGLVSYYNIPPNTFHRALSDCSSANALFQALKKDILSQYTSVDEFYKDNTSSHNSHAVKSADISATVNPAEIDSDNPIYGNHFVFTGKLEKLTRKEAFQLVVNHGGVNDDTVKKETNYLVLGNFDYCKSIKDGKSSKQKKAEKYKLQGYNITVISENVFFDMLE